MPNSSEKSTLPNDISVSANIHDYTFTKDGADNFYWPITHHEMTKFGDLYQSYLAKALNKFNDQDSAIIYKIVANYFANEVCGIFQADLLKHKLQQDSVKLDVLNEWRVWPYIFKNQSPPAPILLDRLRLSAPKSSLIKKLSNPRNVYKLIKRIRFDKGGFTLDGMKISHLNTTLPTNTITVTQRTELITQHAKHTNSETAFCRSDKWFSSIGQTDLEQSLKRADIKLEDELIEGIKELYKNWGISISTASMDFYKSCLKEMGALTRIHYERLLSRNDIPNKLWTGTGGNIWDLMLRLAVISKGGHVTAHDHGGGTAHAKLDLVGFTEMWACHEFITFNKKQSELLTKAVKTWPTLDRTAPIISYIPSNSSNEDGFIIKDKFASNDGEIKNIIFLSTLYDQDRGRTLAFYPDLAYADWQARCMSKLKEWGHNVFFKPHPESRVEPPVAFEKELGFKIINERFEEILSNADLFIIDYTYTSILLPALKSNIPIVIIDFENIPFHPQAKEALEERVSYVPATFNKKNRISIDWKTLKDAIKQAPKKCNNHNFVKTYYLDSPEKIK